MNTQHDVSLPFAVKPAARLVVIPAILLIIGAVCTYQTLEQLVSQYEMEYSLALSIWRGLIGVGGLLVLYLGLYRQRTVSVLREEEVITTWGIIARTQVRVPSTHIAHYGASRGFWQFFLGLGNVNVDSAGTKESEVVMHNLTGHDVREVMHRLKYIADKVEAEVRVVDGEIPNHHVKTH